MAGIDLALAASASISGTVAVEKLATATGGQKCEAGRESFLDEIVLKARNDDPNEKPAQRVTLFGISSIAGFVNREIQF